jgi:ESCRT-II complex subunit VPS36
LDELWCHWNRARGVALVSPKHLKLAVQYLDRYTDEPKLFTLRFPKSGLTILHTRRYSPEAFRTRLLESIDERQEAEEGGGGVGLLEVAKKEELSLGLTKEMIELIEFDETLEGGQGIVRDAGPGGNGEGSQGVRWYRDWITGFEWDGQD